MMPTLSSLRLRLWESPVTAKSSRRHSVFSVIKATCHTSRLPCWRCSIVSVGRSSFSFKKTLEIPLGTTYHNVTVLGRIRNYSDNISAITTQYWQITPISSLRNNRSSRNAPDSKVHGTNMGPIWGRQDPGGPHVGSMNLAIRGGLTVTTVHVMACLTIGSASMSRHYSSKINITCHGWITTRLWYITVNKGCRMFTTFRGKL